MSFPTYVDPIPLPAPVTSGSGIQFYTDPLGDLWVAQNGTAGGNWKRARDALHCRLYRNAALNLQTGTLMQIPMDTVYRDTWGMADGSGGISFAGTTGAFLICGQAAFTATAAAQFILPRLYVGSPGAEQQIGVCQNYSATTSGTISAGLSFTHVATASNAHVLMQATASGTQAIATGILWTYISVSYLGTG